MIGADPSFFHSHMKRQPLNFLGNPLPGIHDPKLSANGGLFSSEVGGGGGGKGRSFIDLGGARGGNVFDVKIERSTEYHVNRTEEETVDEKIRGGTSSVASSSFKDRKVFEEEIESSPLGVAVLNRSVLSFP